MCPGSEKPIMAETAYILLGSNMGDREQFLNAALARMETVEGLEMIAISSVYVSEAEGMPGECPSFLNQAVKGEYKYTPAELLHTLERIERGLGRTDKGTCQPRTIDLDILLFGSRMINTARLTVPHRKLLSRSFALIPLLEIDPDIIHPVTGKPVMDLFG